VTSRILVVDMLSEYVDLLKVPVSSSLPPNLTTLSAKNIPTELITGFVVLHAERVIQTSLEAFVVRLYRQSNLVSIACGNR
jgi:hypothetical protein